ncbi:MAG: thioredoxin domain-containing protein [Actinobacteria bacterium]|nr:thioredoxin domain-containing protein [Actinomycetota bacterium]
MTNRLAHETSPYLLQHAENPVDWFPWGPEAIERSNSEDKPILLSIGYAACHWCHVMERESFENHDIARLMNMWYVPVKVDREERPDLDAIYMDAVQALTGHGGWPMTVFLTPDGKPFYGGTYFPPEDRHGMPGFKRLLEAVHDAWVNQRDDLVRQADELTSHISKTLEPHAREHDPQELTLTSALGVIRDSFDAEWGGFGSAPKFPQPMNIEFLLRMHARGESDALPPADLTLRRMARGGMFDHAGGGFHRYSVDRQWLVPHFEKMLYDNAQLVRTYARAYLVTHDEQYRRTALATADYLLREMRHPDGGFYSSQDADSEGVEGKYYVWSLDEFRTAAGEDADVAAAYWNVTEGGNWESTNILWAPRDDEEVAAELGLPVADILGAVDRARARLRDVRSVRVPPATDDKILTSWNGLAISGLVEAGRIFERADLVDAAGDAARFLVRELRDGAGRLLRSWRDGRTSGPGFLDDYALLAAALLDLYETTFDESWFVESLRLCAEAVRLFADDTGAGFFDTGVDADALLLRPKDVFDNALPCGNSAMAGLLLRLAAFTGEALLEERALAYLKLLQPAMAGSPLGFGHLLGALDLHLARAKEVAIAGDPGSPGVLAMARVVWESPQPNRVLAAGNTEGTSVALLKGRTAQDGAATAYVCEGFFCLAPVTDPGDLRGLLASAGSGSGR